MGHVIADAAYDADPLRAFMADDLGAAAAAQTKANPSRTGKPPIDWRLYKEHNQTEGFFNRLNDFAASPCVVRRRCPPSWASISPAP